MAQHLTERASIDCLEDICIFTFGKFYIRSGDDHISAASSRSKRMWEIFKYLLTYRGKSFFPESILEKIWPDSEYPDPNLIMRAQIFRLRQVLGGGKNNKDSLAANIVFSQGCYSWEDRVDYWLDADAFEKYALEAENVKDVNQDQAVNLYSKAIALYRGEYMPESSFSEWVEPARSHYHDLYLSAVFSLADIYKNKGLYKEIVKLCEQAAAVDYFQERIHLRMMEALMAERLVERARAHYNEVTSAFYRELGIKPSDQMKNLYRLLGVEAGGFELDLGTIQEGLKGMEAEKGAYLCDAQLFRYFYKLERLRVERNGHSVLLGLLTITGANYQKPDPSKLKEVTENLKEVILDSLRKGDLVTFWNEAQFLLLLPGLNREQSEMVIARIENNFFKKHSLRGLFLHKKVESLLPLEGDSHFA